MEYPGIFAKVVFRGEWMIGYGVFDSEEDWNVYQRD